MRVLLADGQTKVRSALRLLLEQEPGLSVVGEVTDMDSLLAELDETRPDLLLLDWGLPGLCTADQPAALSEYYPRLKVVVLSVHPEEQCAALAAGADAFVSKCNPPERLLAALETCCADRTDG